MEDVYNTLNLSDDDEIFRGYTTLIELYNVLKLKTMLFSFKSYYKRFNLGVAFFKSESIYIRVLLK